MDSARIRRWCLVILVGIFSALILTHGVPAIVYRISLSIYRAREDATDYGLKRRLAELNDTSQAFRMVVERVRPSVAHIRTVKLYPRIETAPLESGDRTSPQQFFVQHGQGSGVVVDPNGYVLTNYHVVAEAKEIRVQLPGRSQIFAAEQAGVDPVTDLALLKLTSTGLTFQAATLGNSDEVAVGDWVLAIGNPYGLEQSVTAGIVSATGRRDLLDNVDVQDFIQTDAAINPGNSGGPLVNLKGEVIGINTLTFGEGNKGIGFAIPSKLAKRAASELREYGRIQRGWLGVFLHSVESETLANTGLGDSGAIEIDYVVPNSPSEKAGLKTGDWITEFDGKRFNDSRDLHRRILSTTPGTEVLLKIRRGRQSKVLRTTLVAQPAMPARLPGELEWGVQLGALTPDIRRWVVGTDARGVLIFAVNPRQRAAGKLQPGDVITAINGQPTPDLDAYARLARGMDLNAALELTVRSKNGLRTVTLEVKSE